MTGEAARGRQMFADDVAGVLGIDRHSVNWLNYQANRRRRLGQAKAGDMPPARGREWRRVPSGLGWDVQVEKPWWWEADITDWQARRAQARKAAWVRPRDAHGEFTAAPAGEAVS